MQMKERIAEGLLSLWENHRGACLGLAAGVFFALAILLFGFWQTLFVAFMALAGLWLGHEYDTGADAWSDLKEGLGRLLPVGYLRFRNEEQSDFSIRKER